MLVAKLKGIALAVGTMTAVVSGAVVLAQSGAGPGPGPGDGPVGPTAETKVEARRDPDDRATALEKKLDRVLEALERLSPPAANTVASTATVSPDAVVTSDAPRSEAVPSLPGLPRDRDPLDDLPQGVVVASDPFSPNETQKLPLANRLEAVEKQVQQVQQRLERLERRLKSLDARVGGGEIENTSGPPAAQPGPAPQAPRVR